MLQLHCTLRRLMPQASASFLTAVSTCAHIAAYTGSHWGKKSFFVTEQFAQLQVFFLLSWSLRAFPVYEPT